MVSASSRAVIGSNFDHLAEFDGPLASLGGFAEADFLDGANTSLIKARQFAERLAPVVAERSGVRLEEWPGFFEIPRRVRPDGAASLFARGSLASPTA